MTPDLDSANMACALKTALKPKALPRKKRDGYDLEDPFQIEAATMLGELLPDDCWWCHIPNGGKRPMTTAKRLKRMGTKAGAPDNLIVYRGSAYWIELKARYGSLQESQAVEFPRIERAGAPVGVARTLDDIVALLTGWGIPLRTTLEGYRNREKTVPQRMSASQYRAVMGLDADQPKKKATSWQTKPRAAVRRRTASINSRKAPV